MRRARRAHGEAATAELAVAYSAGDEMTRRRIAGALARDRYAVALGAGSVREVVEGCAGRRVDAAVVACDRAFLEAPTELQVLRSDMPDALIVVVSAADGRRPVRRALAAGADGYVCEPELERTLGPTLRAVAAGQVCIPREMREHFQKPAFSFREKQVLQLVARGFTNSEIAQALFLAESTVKSHLSSSFRKLGVSSRKEAAAIVLDPDSGLNLEVLGGARPSIASDLVGTA